MKNICKKVFIFCLLIIVICATIQCFTINKYNYPIDLVFLWVDGSDTAWQVKKEAALKKYPELEPYAKGSQRWRDTKELKYSLRSVSQYLPWINRIYIVTDNQVPKWLNTKHPKIKIIDHKEILPADALPTFNSMAIETAIHKIPELSEHFIYANDDTFVNLPLEPDFFFDKKGNPIVYARNIDNKKINELYEKYKNEMWMKLWVKPFKLMKERFNFNTIIIDNHNMGGVRKSYIAETIGLFSEEFEKTTYSQFRKEDNMSLMILNLIDRYYERNTILPNKNPSNKLCEYGGVEIYENLELLGEVTTCLFCLNDSSYLTQEDINRKILFMETRFPNPSEYEIKTVDAEEY